MYGWSWVDDLLLYLLILLYTISITGARQPIERDDVSLPLTALCCFFPQGKVSTSFRLPTGRIVTYAGRWVGGWVGGWVSIPWVGGWVGG